MKSMLLAFALFIAAPLAHADSLFYVGSLAGQPVTLKVVTALPAAIEVRVSDPIYDPEYQREVAVPQSISTDIGFATLAVNGETVTAALLGVGDERQDGSLVFAFDAAFPSHALQGLRLDGFLFDLGTTPVLLDSAKRQIEAIQFPQTFSVRYYSTRTADAGLITFTKK